MKKKSAIGSLLLFITAVVWGVAFVAQSEGMQYVGPLTFNGVRFIIGSIVMLPVIFVKDRCFTHLDKADRKKEWKSSMKGGILCGVVLCTASLFQQYGVLVYYNTGDPVGKAGFITALYIIMVPVCGIFMRQKIRPLVWVAVMLSAVGLYFLCITDVFAFGIGDILCFFGAICFTGHIYVIDHFSPGHDGVRISCYQFLVCGVICTIGMFIFEEPRISDILNCAIPILYASVCSSGIAYTFQIIGQKYVEPALASLIMSLESAVSAIAGVLIAGDVLSTRELMGCIIMFAAILLAQLGDVISGRKKAKAEK